MIIKIMLIFVCLVLGLLVAAYFRPEETTISRELIVKSTPEILFPFINNSKKSNEWMPWVDEDPNVKMSYSGPAEGVGSLASWTSTGKMGTGTAEVVESIPNTVVKTKLIYTKPMSMTQMAEVSLKPVADGTLVRWSVTGKSSLIGRVFCMFMDMDKLVGGSFEKGLQRLKTMMEK